VGEDQFTGDGVMALFGRGDGRRSGMPPRRSAPPVGPGRERGRAEPLRCARSLPAPLRTRHRHPLTGPAVVGRMGYGRRVRT
jgi:class 3 adenylate cyclase